MRWLQWTSKICDDHHDSNLLELALEAVERPLGEPDVQAERLLPGQRELLLHRTPSAPDRGVGIGGGLVGKSV